MIEHVRIVVFPDDRVDRKNAAVALGLSPKTLAEWRRVSKGPRAFNVGGRVFYRWSEVQAFAAGEQIAA